MKEVWNMYARELRSCLQCSRTQKNAFLRETKRLAVDYLAGISEPSIEELIEFLGTPEELARSYQDTLGEQSARIYRKQINQKLLLLCTISLVVLVGAIVSTAYCMYLSDRWHDVTITQEETVIIYEESETT